MSRQKITSVVFDLGGVLADLDRERCEASFRALGLDGMVELIDPYHPSAILHELESGTADLQALHDYAVERWGVELPAAEIGLAYNSFVGEVAAWKLDYLLELRGRGLRTFMLSNTSDVIFSEVSRREFTRRGLSVHDYFEGLYLSYRMGVMKPRPEIFEAMAADACLIPAETLFIDDSPANVATAKELGFATLHAVQGEDFRPRVEALLGV